MNGGFSAESTIESSLGYRGRSPPQISLRKPLLSRFSAKVLSIISAAFLRTVSTLLAGDLDYSGHSAFRYDHAPVDE